MTKRAVVMFALAALALVAQSSARVQAQGAPSLVVISQVYGAGGITGATYRNDYVELFNRSQTAVSLNGLSLQFAAGTGTLNFSNTTPVVLPNVVLQPGKYFLVGLASSGGAGAVLPPVDHQNGLNVGNTGKLALVGQTAGLPCNGSNDPCNPAELALILDLVGYGTTAQVNFFEGAAPAPGLSATRADFRLLGGCQDTNQNGADFELLLPQPRNSQSPLNDCFPPPPALLPHEVQGAGSASPLAGDFVHVRGVVTARVGNGFYLQTPDAEADANAATSEGLFVFTAVAPNAVAVADLVEVTGTVVEFQPAGDPQHPRVTHLVAGGDEGPAFTVLASGSAMPAARVVTAAMLTNDAAMESLEGMRVVLDGANASATVVGPTGGSPAAPGGPVVSDGVFFVTFPGVPRPAREAGIHTLDHDGFAAQCASAPCAIPEFDGNPERLRVDSDAQLGAAAFDVAAGQSVSGLRGVLDFAARTWTLLPDPGALSAGPDVVAVGAAFAGDNQFAVASLNLGGLYDTADDPNTSDAVFTSADLDSRLAKASEMLRLALGSPDVVGVQEVENLAVLGALADRVNADSALSCPGPLCYSALLLEGSDPAGLDVGFLVRGRVLSASVAQEFVSNTFVDPDDNSTDLLFEHPPLVLTGVVDGPSGHNVDVVVVVNHLEPMDGLGGASNRVAAKRRAQAEVLGGLLQNRQATAPVRVWGTAPVLSLGNYNALDLNDGFVDVLGASAGAPAAANAVVLSSQDNVNPDFANATAGLYTAVGDGSTQALDHMLVSAASLPPAGVSVARVNADFPAVFANGTGPVRLSPRDPASVFFSFPADTVAPSLGDVPADMTVEGNTLGGAVVSFDAPTAVDDVDGAVAVSCLPGSGATFSMGTTTVTCSAEDSSGNDVSASFTVTVVDTTPPQLSLPSAVNANAADRVGVLVSYSATAVDLVAGVRTPVCSPASGTLFPLGATTVSCTVDDGNGNSTSGSFVVNVAQATGPVRGSMHGFGFVGPRRKGTEFAFHVKEAPKGLDRGWLMLQVRDGWRVSSFVSAMVRAVAFSDSVEFSSPMGVKGGSKAGIDTVVFTGVGWWKGRAGYTFEARAEDHGEPGQDNDRLFVVIKDPRGVVVHTAEGTLTYGNIKSVPVQ